MRYIGRPASISFALPYGKRMLRILELNSYFYNDRICLIHGFHR